MTQLWKKNVLLASLLFLQLGWLGVRNLEDSAPTTAIPGKLLESFEHSDLTQLTITEGDTQDAEVILKRSDEVPQWHIEQQDNYPADPNKVKRLLRSISGLQIASVVSTSAKHHIDFGVAPSAFQKKITLHQDTTNQILYVGKKGRGDTTHIRLDGSDTVYTVRNFSVWSLESQSKAWLNPTYMELESDKVALFELTTPDRSLQLRHHPADAWTVSTKKSDRTSADSAKVATFLKQLETLKLKSIVGPQQTHSERLKSAPITLKIGIKADLDLELSAPDTKQTSLSQKPTPIESTFTLYAIAPQDDSETYEVWLEGDDHVVTMDKEVLDAITGTKATSFEANP